MIIIVSVNNTKSIIVNENSFKMIHTMRIK